MPFQIAVPDYVRLRRLSTNTVPLQTLKTKIIS